MLIFFFAQINNPVNPVHPVTKILFILCHGNCKIRAANLAQSTGGTRFQVHHFGISAIHCQYMGRAELDADFTAFAPFFFDGDGV